jgi:succinylglutamate desuccinylase
MISVEFETLGTSVSCEREIFRLSHQHEGPLLVISAGVHGNEPSGVIALDRVRRYLEAKRVPIKGDFIGMAGNLKALDISERFVDQDLNRSFGKEEVKTIENADGRTLNSEQREALEIMKYINSLNPKKYINKWFIDCHTTSSESIPYFSVGDAGGSLTFAHRFPVHSVLGFSDLIPTTMDHWLRNQGFNGFTLEAGQHDELSSVENCEAVIFMALVNAGCVSPDDIDCYGHCRDVLAKVIFEDKKIFNIIHRHAVDSDDGFIMEPGFVNFQRVNEGERLARDHNGEINAKRDARVLMPLYQKQGDDGFFLIEEKKPEAITS